MSLGLAKDSLLDLAAMAKEAEAKEVEAAKERGLSLDPAAAGMDIDREKEGLESTAPVSLTPEEQAMDEKPVVTLARDSLVHLSAVEAAKAQVLNGKKTTRNGNRKVESKSSYGHYSGFAADYAEYSSYHDVNLYKKETKNLWCCLFPWFAQQKIQPYSDEYDSSEEEKHSYNKALPRSVSREEDEYSTGSDVFGEKLSDKEKQAMLARIGLAQPDDAVATGESLDKKGLLNGIYDRHGSPNSSDGKRGGILKRRTSVSKTIVNQNSSSQVSLGSSDQGQHPSNRRRSLFPTYENQPKKKINFHVNFAPMARVVTVKSKNDMSKEEKTDIWWQKSDYESFKKTGRIITKAMLEGGSEIWLASNPSWRNGQNAKASTTLQNIVTMSERPPNMNMSMNKGKVISKSSPADARDKWWHKFGHSRRGLEHIASMEEGSQRQANVRTAVRAVVDENRRQKLYRREDPEKLRSVSVQHTSWARDLALAAGASDADAVRSNFDEARKSREFYLLKLSKTDHIATKGSFTVPKFMQPAMAFSPLKASQLDANTCAQIRYRRKTAIAPSAPAPAPIQSSSPTVGKNSLEPIHDPKTNNSASIAKRATGFLFDDSGKKVDMSAVLSGMGVVATT